MVSRRQLLDLGLTVRAIDHRVRAGRLHVLYRGVYAVGHRVVKRQGWWMAAVLAAGPDAVLSHRSAAALWGIRASAAPRIDVTVPRALRQRPDLRFHRTQLPDDEVTAEDGIPVTSPSRTLFDLADGLTLHQLERATDQAEVLRLTSELSLEDVVQRHPHHPGAGKARAIIANARIGQHRTRSDLEDLFLAFLDDCGLPRPNTNAWLTVDGTGYEVDCHWPDANLIVELDGRAFHHTKRAFEEDRERDRRLNAAGLRVVRVTWRALQQGRAALTRDLLSMLH